MIYFSSDTHFWHLRALELMPTRPTVLNVTSIPEMNEAILCRFGAKLTEEDTTIFLGDFLMGLDKDVHLPNILSRIPGTKILIVGNHDPLFKPNSRYEEYYDLYRSSGFSKIYSGSVRLREVLDVDCPDYLLCHFPYLQSSVGYTNPEDLKEPRFASSHPKDTGLFLLHGHTHSLDSSTAENMYHVGVEANNYFPVSLEDIQNVQV